MACITITACIALTACEDKNISKYNGTYYGYLDGTYLTSNGQLLEGTYTLTLTDGKWTGSNDTGNKNFFEMKSGEYEIEDGAITLYFQMGNFKITAASGSVEEDGFKFSILENDVNYIYSFKTEKSE